MSTAVTLPPAAPEHAEATTLASEMAAAFARMTEYYRRQYDLTPQEAMAHASGLLGPCYGDGALTCPPHQVTWFGLQNVANTDPARAVQRWEEVKHAALMELRSGHRAAKTMDGLDGDCWQRAQFLAVRHDLAEAWQPRTGVERQLIDLMTQARVAVFQWMEKLARRSSVASMNLPDDGMWKTPSMSDAEAVEQAAAMVDRFNKMFLRTLKALLDLRRVVPAVVVQNAGQVNVAGQQVNVAAATAGRRATRN
jgi:hypothetical protein